MRFLDLCSGIGGFSLGLEWAGMTCSGQVEIDPFCNRVLEKHWPHVPRWKDLKDERNYEQFPAVDLVCGGYPCQPFSHAGKRRGADDDRHLWPYVFKVVQRLRPAWCLFENVAGHVTLGLDTVLSELEGEGYACRPVVIPACALDAPHIRKRVWILAHSERPERRPRESSGHDADRETGERQKATSGAGNCGEKITGFYSDSDKTGREELDTSAVSDSTRFGAGVFAPQWRKWPAEPGVGRVAHGVPNRLDRCGALGNAIVPQLAEVFGLAIMAAHYERMESCPTP